MVEHVKPLFMMLAPIWVWFVSWLLHFLSSSRVSGLGKAEEDGPIMQAVHLVGDLDEALAFVWLSPECCRHVEHLSFSLCNSAFPINKSIFKSNWHKSTPLSSYFLTSRMKNCYLLISRSFDTVIKH